MINKRIIDHLLCGSSLLYETSYKKDRCVGFVLMPGFKYYE